MAAVSSEKFEVRLAQTADLPRLAQLMEDYRAFYGKPPLEPSEMNSFLEDLLSRPNQALHYLLIVEGEVAGFTTLYFTFSSVQAQRVSILNDLYIKPEFRGNGYGAILFRAARNYSDKHGFAYMQLETHVSNTLAQSLYTKEGGKVCNDFLVFEFSPQSRPATI